MQISSCIEVNQVVSPDYYFFTGRPIFHVMEVSPKIFWTHFVFGSGPLAWLFQSIYFCLTIVTLKMAVGSCISLLWD